MDPLKAQILSALEAQWELWPLTKDNVIHYGFTDYVKAEFGLSIKGYDKATFDYVITDEKKFTWFLLSAK